MVLGDRRLLVITADERQGRSIARTLRMLCSVEIRALASSRSGSNVTASDLSGSRRPAALVLSGISLRQTHTVRAVQQVIHPFLECMVPVLCLLEAVTQRDEVQARVMGAARVLSVDVPVRQLAETVRELAGITSGKPPSVEEAASRAAVQDVGRTLAKLMDAAASGRAVERDVTAEATALLMQAVSDSGIARWMATVRHVDDPTYRHCLLMAGLMSAFVISLGARSEDCERMTRAGILHDIGKALIPIEITNKPTALTDEEMVQMRRHAALGYELLVMQGYEDQLVLDVVRSHHEYLDGSGYPDGLSGKQIPDVVRIATLCDVFAALIEKRAYKAELPATDAYAMMRQMSGRLDRDLLKAFGRIFVPHLS